MSKTTPFPGLLYAGMAWILMLCGISEGSGQRFSQNQVNFNGHPSVQSGTSLSFGPDGRLYVTEYLGQIKIYTLERESPGKYKVTASEILSDIQQIPDHNDDGTPHDSPYRQTIGLTVVGTPEHPVFYVSSSDVRIGGGGGGGSGDVGLDTNSGVITRFTWMGDRWEVVDIVRGLPRSEENHATNGMEYVVINGEEYLLVSQGGNTNAGGPSANFAYTTEYALSAAVLAVNLSMLQNMPILEDNGRKYIYDLPTLDDPTRPNKNGIDNPDAPGYDGVDVNDPWGGNDGLNQAVIVPGGPVQIFSPGYRNTFDLVVTQSGAVYVTDNGANGGWGGFPENEGMDGNVTNNYLPGEPGSSSPSDGEKINNVDHLTLVTLNVDSYAFGSFYGGHPTPVRANPYGAGLYTNPAQTGTEGAVFRTLIYHPEKNENGFTNDPNLGLPANWPPVQVANPVEGDWRGPGIHNPDGPDDVLVTTWGTNTNAIAEYTASNFGGAMKGNLLAGVNTGLLRRVELEPDGSLKALHSSFISGLGGDALGVTANGDDDIFPGTIWVVTLNGKLVALEPQDFIECVLPGDPGYDPMGDNDFDGYTNQDEIDNGTDPCNGGSQPQDFNKEAGGVLISDLNDPDDDSDGIPDHEDPFQLGDPLKDGSDAFELPVINELFSSNPDLKGYMGLGMTGLMNNGEPGPNWLLWLDRRDDPNDPNPNDILGGAIGAMTMQMTSGTAFGTSNDQEKGFQYGVQVDQSTGEFIVAGGLVNFYDPLQIYGNTAAPAGEIGIFIGDGFQSDYIKFVMTPSGLLVQQESNDILGEPIVFPLNPQERPQGGMTLFFIVDPQTGQVELAFSRDNDPRVSIGTLMAQGKVLQAIQSPEVDLAVGMIGTSNQTGVEVEGTWDFLNVTPEGPYITEEIEDILVEAGSESIVLNLAEYFSATFQSDLTFSLVHNSNPDVEVSLLGSMLQINVPQEATAAEVTIQAADAQGRSVTQTFTVTVEALLAIEVLYRVNTGGPELAALDGGMVWGADTKGNNSPYLSTAGNNMTYAGKINSYTTAIDQSVVPVKLFASERYDNVPGAPNVTYSFPVPSPGLYEVRLYMGDGYSGTSQPGARIFDVKLEGIVPDALKDVDLSSRFGSMVGGLVSQTVEVTDGILDIEFLHVLQNPVINGIEILGGASVGELPIVIEPFAEQVHYEGDQMDGSLVIIASGGQGNLNYSMTGQPEGIVIEPTNGLISGTIASNAAEFSPYTVEVTVDDGDEISSDAATMSFTWIVNSGEVRIGDQLPDISRQTGSPQEQIDLNNYFSVGNGKSLTYSITQVSDSLLGVSLEGSLLTLSFPDEPVSAVVTVRATDSDDNFVEQSFEVVVADVPVNAVLYRVNAGGSLVASIDEDMDWGADTKGVNSPYLSQPARNLTYSGGIKDYTAEVDLAKVPTTIFKTERYDDQPGPPNLTYSFPVPVPGSYQVRLYLGDGFKGTADPGKRVFSVKLEGVTPASLDNIDLSSQFGNMVGGVVSHTVEVTDGVLDIEFLHGIQNPLVNGIEILGGAPVDDDAIVVEQLSDQVNYPGDLLAENLQVMASGGHGSLNYSITGQPQGVTINAADGMLSGVIAQDAAQGSPYSATVTVEDEDPETQPATMHFTWTIHSGEPVIVNQLPDISRQTGSPQEQINLDEYFTDNQALVYSIIQVSDSLLGVSLDGSLLILSFPDEPVSAVVTVRATDSDDNFVEQSFEVSVTEQPVSSVLYRINAGGPAIPSIDNEMDWSGDTRGSKSPYLVEAARNMTFSGKINSYTSEVDLSRTPTTLFKTERYDDLPGPPNLKYAFPVPEPGAYQVNLYMGDGYAGTAAEGARIFNVKIEGNSPPSLQNIDLSTKFGNLVGGVISHTVEVQDGLLEIEFLHVVQNPLINGIEILGSSGEETNELEVASIPNQTSVAGKPIPTGLIVSASGGQRPLTFSMEGAPEGVSIDSQTGEISGVIDPSAAIYSPYQVSVTVQSQDTTETVSISFTWVVNHFVDQPWTVKGEDTNYTPRHENSFVQAGEKFYLMGGRENARTIDVYDYNTDTWTALVNSAPVEFNHFQATEYQGLIWIIGAFKTNTYPEELPADYIWIFDPVSTQWIQGPEIPQSRRRGSAGLVVFQDKFYVIGGNTKGHNGGYVSWFDQYDPKTGVWTPLDDAPRARDHFHAEVIDGRLYAVGGRLSGGLGGTFKPVIPEVDVFDFQTGHWSVLPTDLPTPRAGAAVAGFNNQLVVIGGEVEQELVYGTYRDDALEITEAYDPQTGQWSRWGDLNFKRHGTQVIVSGEGLYVLAGSPKKGGGNQKHMEYLGVDNPMGTVLIQGMLEAPESVEITQGNEEAVVVYNNGGNTGVFINSVSISGTDAAHFELGSGAFDNVLLAPGDSLELDVIYNGSLASATASIDLRYGEDQIFSIQLEGTTENMPESGPAIANAFHAQLVPNPVLNNAVLSLEAQQEVNGIQIYSFNGSLLRSFEPKKITMGRGRYNLELSNLPMGMYFVRVHAGELVQTLQFIKR